MEVPQANFAHAQRASEDGQVHGVESWAVKTTEESEPKMLA